MNTMNYWAQFLGGLLLMTLSWLAWSAESWFIKIILYLIFWSIYNPITNHFFGRDK